MHRESIAKNTLFYGDNLDILREYVPSESVDLIYLDPPFNSNRSYNVLFRDESGKHSEAQIEAFEDTWHWGPASEETLWNLQNEGSYEVSKAISALEDLIGKNQVMAYLVMMAARLVELHRVLKPTGSLYLHCDPTSSHYLKVILDAIFGPTRFLNEITWKRTTAHNDPKRYGRIQDRLLFYAKTPDKTFNRVPGSYSEEQLGRYKYRDERGPFRAENLTAPTTRSRARLSGAARTPAPTASGASRQRSWSGCTGRGASSCSATASAHARTATRSTSTRLRVRPCRTYGRISGSAPPPANASGTLRRSRWLSWSASSPSAATPATWYSTRSAAAARP